MVADQSCPFCHPASAPVLRNDLVFALYDAHPVTPGHMLLIPYRHVASFFDVTQAEHQALADLLSQAKSLLDETLAPDGYNLGVNIGDAAGQTVPHVHVHVIPRVVGDVEKPRGGVRGVIPSKQSY